MVSRAFRLIVLGAPGSGKGTISKRIVRDFDLKYLASGDLLRAQMLQQNGIGLEAKTCIEKGRLVPDSLIIKLIIAELTKMNKIPWLLDGFPRTVVQAKALQNTEPVTLAINLDVPTNVIVERIKGRLTHLPSGRIYHSEFNPPKTPAIDDITGEPLVQRDDDKPQVVTERLQNYGNNMKQILDFYRQMELLQEFHGTESNEIWPRVHKFLSKFLQPNSGP